MVDCGGVLSRRRISDAGALWVPEGSRRRWTRTGGAPEVRRKKHHRRRCGTRISRWSEVFISPGCLVLCLALSVGYPVRSVGTLAGMSIMPRVSRIPRDQQRKRITRWHGSCPVPLVTTFVMSPQPQAPGSSLIFLSWASQLGPQPRKGCDSSLSGESFCEAPDQWLHAAANHPTHPAVDFLTSSVTGWSRRWTELLRHNYHKRQHHRRTSRYDSIVVLPQYLCPRGGSLDSVIHRLSFARVGAPFHMVCGGGRPTRGAEIGEAG
ncbi:hypothetical protein B0T11DRAFT_19578 [Plectosphaerella cucumerina]|uniref:Uncharacterized protein n=1 Tax=Plectosphaerella cucumerina TaxID=40658 RepID=A0A8K0XA12_9PEZI|nr:hypothetical protein B0T11DRAFT_19578 [Plectosphaerella cucumerina]